jgi:hypothetical protein
MLRLRSQQPSLTQPYRDVSYGGQPTPVSAPMFYIPPVLQVFGRSGADPERVSFTLSNRYAPRTRFDEVFMMTTAVTCGAQDFLGFFTLIEKIARDPSA